MKDHERVGEAEDELAPYAEKIAVLKRALENLVRPLGSKDVAVAELAAEKELIESKLQRSLKENQDQRAKIEELEDERDELKERLGEGKVEDGGNGS